MKPFTVPVITIIIGSVILRRLGFLSETEKVGYTYCQKKIAKMTVMVSQGHWQ